MQMVVFLFLGSVDRSWDVLLVVVCARATTPAVSDESPSEAPRWQTPSFGTRYQGFLRGAHVPPSGDPRHSFKREEVSDLSPLYLSEGDFGSMAFLAEPLVDRWSVVVALIRYTFFGWRLVCADGSVAGKVD